MTIIRSLLDTDFYKFTMMQAVLHNYPSIWVKYKFKWRNFEKMKLYIDIEKFFAEVKREIATLCSLRFNKDELSYLQSIPYFKKDFIEYLKLFQFNDDYVKVQPNNIIVEGPWISTILFEVPILAIVSQLYTKYGDTPKATWLPEAKERLKKKLIMLDNNIHRDQKFLFTDFGTRRRADAEWHEYVINYILQNYSRFFQGTSNVHLAMKYGIKPIGTMAHEFLQAHQQLGTCICDSQTKALQVWANEYRGELGIALSDVIGFKAFLQDFDRYFALLFEGCRHDSGDPIQWVKDLIDHYRKLRIDPRTKTAVFSDGLTFEIALDLYRRFHSDINMSFGIGTYLVNDCGFTAPQIVMKMVECNHRPVAKISDTTGKGMCEDQEFLDYLKKVIKNKTKDSLWM